MAGRAKGLEKFDRNGVVQHRNYVCEIALKKTISTFQKEGKMLEKELREITKVRETLRQIRAPLRRKVFEASLADQSESDEGLKGGQPMRRRKISSSAMPNARASESALEEKTQRKQSTATDKQPDVYRSRTSMSSASRRFSQTVPQSSARSLSNRRPKQSVEGETLRRRKISAPAHFGLTTPNASSSNEGFLPPISPTVPGNSPKTIRCTPEMNSTCGSDEDTNTSQFLSPSRAESLRYTPLTPIPRGRGLIDPEEDKSLTMEETLRIKGKFRQIGHSIIATALLKGLRQKGQLTSEAIHNMHKPVSVNSTQKEEDKEESDGKESEEEEEGEGKKASVNLNMSKFRAAARKTINVNRLINRRRSQSDPTSRAGSDSYQPVTKGDLQQKSLADEQEKVEGASRKTSEDRGDVCVSDDDEEEESRSHVGNPLMNAHIARRRKFGVTAQVIIAGSLLAARARSAAGTADVGRDQAYDGAGDAHLARNSRALPAEHTGIEKCLEGRERDGELDSKEAGDTGTDTHAKTVRFKLDAWE